VAEPGRRARLKIECP